MSRVILFGLDNFSSGEVTAVCNRGWMLDGSPSTSGGGSTSIQLSADMALHPDLELGRMVLVEHPRLGPWAGVIDTPWAATRPVKVTLYNATYLLKLRAPETPTKFTGTVYEIVSQILEAINAQEETYMRMGEASAETDQREETFDQRSFWDQLSNLLKRAGMELLIRPERRETRLYLFLDVMKRIGLDTGFLLHDGENANFQVTEATVDGEIWNRITGIGNQSMSRLYTDPQLDEESIDHYRARSRTERSQAGTQSLLQDNTLTALAHDKQPYIKIKGNVLDVEAAFENVRPGNGMLVHASRLVLPGAVKGWRGYMRIMAMDFNEQNNTVGVAMEAAL